MVSVDRKGLNEGQLRIRLLMVKRGLQTAVHLSRHRQLSRMNSLVTTPLQTPSFLLSVSWHWGTTEGNNIRLE